MATPSTRLATRLCLVLTSTKQICLDRHLEVADLLASASSNETALGAAVLLEQSAAHYFEAEMYRKYAFHMLMAGHMFRSAEQQDHAFRCFTSALYIYRDGRWDELHNHLRSALALQLYSMGRMGIALQLYSKLLGPTSQGRVSAKSQQKFINHLLEICREHPKKALAGADRMVAPSNLSGAERDAVRQAALDRIVQVVRYTRSASRVLELPNISLPLIDDRTIRVVSNDSPGQRGFGTGDASATTPLGRPGLGDESKWAELILATVAELRAASKITKTVRSDEDAVSKTLAQISVSEIRQVIAEMDKEKTSLALVERSKRSPNYKEAPPVRAQMEPIGIEFVVSNPLGVMVEVTDFQLVARMSDENGGKICTNEDAVYIRPFVSTNEKRKWTFQSSLMEFEVPDFCRVSAGSGNSETDKWKSALEADPLFVVAKCSVTLEPDSEKKIILSICPLDRGDLEIIGVRGRLYNNVWIYHPFHVKGALLQTTRSHRANRVRADPVLLKCKVERGMPCLTMSLVPKDPHHTSSQVMVHGQVSTWTLRLANVGTAAATNVTLKSNLPWINILEDHDSSMSPQSLENRATSFCVGPTGTLMSLPIRGSHAGAEGRIKPGEVAEIDIQIRANTSGRSNLYLLFRYELLDQASPTVRHRWTRTMFEMSVYPSLSFSATSLPSYSGGEHLISLELCNNRSDRPDKLEVVLQSIGLVSRGYKLQPIPNQFGDSSGVVQIGWQERIFVLYRVAPMPISSAACLISESQFNATEVTSRPGYSASELTFVCLERAHEEFTQSWRSHQRALARAATSSGQQNDLQPRTIAEIRRTNTAAEATSSGLSNSSSSVGEGDENRRETAHPTSIGRLRPQNSDDSVDSVDLLCTWRASLADIEGCDPTAAKGCHYIRRLALRPAASAISSTKSDCPISVSASYGSNIQHDFRQGPVRVPFVMTLRNLHRSTAINFELSTLDSKGSLDYIGPDGFRSSLRGCEERKVPMEALIPAAGVYNLQNVSLAILDKKDSPREFGFPHQWTVLVRDKSTGKWEQ
jgi:ER-Golgi trafficking TRAPP I complex 85 kDa subunit